MKHNGYTALANAVIEQVVDDYRNAISHQEREVLKRFFLSDWFSVLSNLDGKMIIRRLEAEIKNSVQ